MNNFEKIKAMGMDEMARIGGKGMTRERDRIQENANRYIVKNCPAMHRYYYTCEKYGMCQDCTDCVIKQVIEIAKDIIEKDCYENSDAKAEKILQLFNIEEINK